MGNDDILHIKIEEWIFNCVLLLHYCLKLILERRDDKVTILIKEEMENVVLL